jgi:hypothetical protein
MCALVEQIDAGESRSSCKLELSKDENAAESGIPRLGEEKMVPRSVCS